MTRTMRVVGLSSVCALGLVLATSTSQAVRMPPGAKQPAAAKAGKEGDKGADPQRCERMKQAMDARGDTLQNMQGESARYAAEFNAAQARLAELQNLRTQIDAQIKKVEDRIAREKANWDRVCGTAQTCANYDKYVDRIEATCKPVEDELKDIQAKMATATTDISQLEQKIPPLQKAYTDNKCANMVPGETEQATIDICMKTFSDWNRFQADLNRLRPQLKELEARFAERSQQLKSMQAPLDEYNAYLEKNCKDSQKMAAIKAIRVRKANYDKLGTNISDVMKRLNNISGVRITIDTK